MTDNEHHDYEIEVGADGLSRTYQPGDEPSRAFDDLPAVPRVVTGYEIGVAEADNGDKAIILQVNRRSLSSEGEPVELEPVVLVWDVMTMGGFITRMLSTLRREF